MVSIQAKIEFCCKRFQKANASGLIYLGVLAPNVKAWMSDIKAIWNSEDKTLQSCVNVAGASGLAWTYCPYCHEKL